jgi:hypothetical protein
MGRRERIEDNGCAGALFQQAPAATGGVRDTYFDNIGSKIGKIEDMWLLIAHLLLFGDGCRMIKGRIKAGAYLTFSALLVFLINDRTARAWMSLPFCDIAPSGAMALFHVERQTELVADRQEIDKCILVLK